MVGTGRFDSCTDFMSDANADGGNVPSFDFALHQTDRLVAEASGGNEQGNVRVHRLNAVRGFHRGFPDQLMEQWPVDVTHE